MGGVVGEGGEEGGGWSSLTLWEEDWLIPSPYHPSSILPTFRGADGRFICLTYLSSPIVASSGSIHAIACSS